MMRLPSLTHIYLTGFFFLELSYLGRFLYASGLVPLYQQLLLLGAFIPILGMVLMHLRFREPAARLSRTLRDASPLLWGFSALAVWSLIGGILPDANTEDHGKRVFYAPFALLVVVAAILASTITCSSRDRERYALVALLGLGCTVMIDGFYPGTFTKRLDRAAGFATGPNAAALASVLLLSCVVDYERVRKRDVAIASFTSLVVFLTLSRGGFVVLAFFGVLYTASAVWARRRRIRVLRLGALGVAASALILCVGTLAYRWSESSPLFQHANARNRLAILAGDTSIVREGEKRVQLVYETVELISQRPFVGWGSGFGHSLGTAPHNMYLHVWLNHGLIGLALYMVIILLSVVHFLRRKDSAGAALCILIVLAGFFSHNVLENYTFLLLYGVSLACSVERNRLEPRSTNNLRHPTGQQGLVPSSAACADVSSSRQGTL